MQNTFLFKIMLSILILFGMSISAMSSVNNIQAAIEANQLDWTAGESWITGLSREEQRKRCGAITPSREQVASRKIALPLLDFLPSQFDWRNNQGQWVTPVRHQGACGSCWDFSAVAQVESWWKIQNGDPNTDIDLSEQFILSCSDAGNCTSGGSVGAALNIIQSLGIPAEDCFPYAADDTLSCDLKCDDWNENLLMIPGWGYVTGIEPRVEVIKSAVYRHPVSATYMVYEDFMAYAGGVYEHVTGDLLAGHAILIVGWNDADSSWICKNSWGPFWGEDGYFRIKWGNCNIGTNVEFIWNDLIHLDRLKVLPEQFHFVLGTNETTQSSLKLFNFSDKMLEYAVQDYEVPVKFHLSEFNAGDGASWWCGDAELGGYDNHWLQYLEINDLNLMNAVDPEFVFRGFWAIEDPAGATDPYDGWDGFNVWISRDGGKTYQVILPDFPDYNCESLWSFGDAEQGWKFGPGIPGWAGTSDGWQNVRFDLAGYQSQSLNIRFAFASDMGFCTADDPKVTGVFVDDIVIKDKNRVYFENYGTADSRISRTGFGQQAAEWLQVSSPMGEITPGDSVLLEIMIDPRGFVPGDYRGKLRIATNLVQDSVKEIDCKLTIEEMNKIAVSVDDNVPEQIQIQQNYPNPFNIHTRIQFKINDASDMKVFIYNAIGQKIRVLYTGFRLPGHYEILWEGKDDAGIEVGSGTYFFKIIAGSNVKTRKILLVK